MVLLPPDGLSTTLTTTIPLEASQHDATADNPAPQHTPQGNGSSNGRVHHAPPHQHDTGRSSRDQAQRTRRQANAAAGNHTRRPRGPGATGAPSPEAAAPSQGGVPAAPGSSSPFPHPSKLGKTHLLNAACSVEQLLELLSSWPEGYIDHVHVATAANRCATHSPRCDATKDHGHTIAFLPVHASVRALRLVRLEQQRWRRHAPQGPAAAAAAAADDAPHVGGSATGGVTAPARPAAAAAVARGNAAVRALLRRLLELAAPLAPTFNADTSVLLLWALAQMVAHLAPMVHAPSPAAVAAAPTGRRPAPREAEEDAADAGAARAAPTAELAHAVVASLASTACAAVRARQLPPHKLHMLVWAAAALGVDAPTGPLRTAAAVAPPALSRGPSELWGLLARELEVRAPGLSARDASVALWALATARQHDDAYAAFDALVERMARLVESAATGAAAAAAVQQAPPPVAAQAGGAQAAEEALLLPDGGLPAAAAAAAEGGNAAGRAAASGTLSRPARPFVPAPPQAGRSQPAQEQVDVNGKVRREREPLGGGLSVAATNATNAAWRRRRHRPWRQRHCMAPLARVCGCRTCRTRCGPWRERSTRRTLCCWRTWSRWRCACCPPWAPSRSPASPGGSPCSGSARRACSPPP